jgi:hypothetical protein
MTRESVRERHRLLIETDWSKAGKTRIDSISYGDEDVSHITHEDEADR